MWYCWNNTDIALIYYSNGVVSLLAYVLGPLPKAFEILRVRCLQFFFSSVTINSDKFQHGNLLSLTKKIFCDCILLRCLFPFVNYKFLLSKSESVKCSLIESVIYLFTDSSEKKYFSLSNQSIFTEIISKSSCEWLKYTL